jgi:iron complex outermembrane receptor protein
VVERSATFNYWSYEASMRYEISDHLAVYARTGRGQKSGGFNSPYRSISQPPFLPEQVTDYEVGFKSRNLLNDTLNLNVALYTSSYQNMQRYTSSLTVGGSIASLVFNVGSARIRGVEADFTFSPVKALTFSGFMGYTDAKYRQFNVSDAAGTVYDLSGQTFYQTPKVTARLGFVYDVPVSHGSLKIGGGWNYQSSSSLYLFTYSQFTQKAYSLFDAPITYSPSDNFDIAVWGTNLADTQYAQGATVSPVSGFNPALGFNSGALVPGESRVVGVTGTVRF